jgi:hypothetical protein
VRQTDVWNSKGRHMRDIVEPADHIIATYKLLACLMENWKHHFTMISAQGDRNDDILSVVEHSNSGH